MTMDYRGFEAEVTYDRRSEQLSGVVINASGSIRFHASTVAALREEFHAVVDRWLAACERSGVPAKAES